MTLRAGGARRQRTILLFLLMSVGFGTVAAFLDSSVTARAGGGSSTFGSVPAVFWVDLLAVGIPLYLGLWMASRLLQRFREGASLPAGPAVVTFLVVALLALGLLAIASHRAQSAWSMAPGSSSAPPHSVPSDGDATVNTTNGSGATTGAALPPLAIPSWVETGLLVGAALAAAAILSVYAVAVRRFPQAANANSRAAVADALLAFRDSLGDDLTLDAKESIRALYARLLAHLEDLREPTAALTPREIEARLIRIFSVRRHAAAELTSLFEVARYSTQPLPADAAFRGRTAAGEALEDLAALGRSRTRG
ncbi:MAG: DUF4129 domain-containing protein [Thermoplasmata archaeon]|nr:DUF4129 domain-containing protein [Thermoplasmata archaeon]MCI4337686.1 DUF4129 domain-containing protein [Thermoplasmata archaeon]MCI4341322.1 DUF4129 domain-containing protein [Thermoplasmata archaeon]